MRYIISIIIAAIVGFGSGGFFGFDYGLSQCPEPVEVPVYKIEVVPYDDRVLALNSDEPIPPPEIRYIEVPSIKTVFQDVPVYITREVIVRAPLQTDYFKSLSEFKKWVAKNHGPISLPGIKLADFVPEKNDCDDYAERWARQALDDGYIVWACPVQDGIVLKTYVGPPDRGSHVGLWTFIDNDVYYWEPLSGLITKLNVTRD